MTIPKDLSPQEYQVLGVLLQPNRRIEDLTPDRIGETLGLDPGEVTALINRLVADGVIENSPPSP